MNAPVFDFSDEHKMAQQMLRKWCESELSPHVAAMEKGEILPYEIGRKMWSTFGIGDMAKAAVRRIERKAAGGNDHVGAATKVPGDHEDSDGGTNAALVAIAAMELSRVCPGFALAVGASVGLAGGAIMTKGSLAQKTRFGLPLLTLEKIGAWGMTEPSAGSDAFGGMRTVARRDGDDFVLSGSKTFITNAPYADILIVYAKVASVLDGEDGAKRPIHAFILERGMPGLTLGKPLEKMGMHSSPTGEIFLDEVRVPRAQLLGEEDKKPSRDSARDAFNGERTAMVPMCLGIVERCLDDSVRYARERVTFGRPIGEYQLIQDKLARMYVHRENIRNLLFKQLHVAATGGRTSRAEASACKLYCARATTEVALEAVQLMGGNGYMREFHVEMLMRDAKLFQIGGGTDEIQILTIARELLAGSV